MYQYRCSRINLTLPLAFVLQLFAYAAIFAHLPNVAFGQIAYRAQLSDARKQELRNIAQHMRFSVNTDKYPCDDYYDYVCSRNRPMYSILGHLPNVSQIVSLMSELQMDPDRFDAKQKLNDFFISCNTVKSVEDCYRESFVYFKPLFGYIITKLHLEDYHLIDFFQVLIRFLAKSERTDDFMQHPIRARLSSLKEKFEKPNIYFRVGDLNREYKDLRVYRESYEHNLRNLEKHRKRNSTYEIGMQRFMLDWSLYAFQSRYKPMAYYYATFDVHLWMTLYNNTIRYFEPKRLQQIGECLNLPQYVNVLEEARVLAVVYLKSFRNAYMGYEEWVKASQHNTAMRDQENEVLREYFINDKLLFFTLYAQNFCDFGKELSENVFYLGLKENRDFFNIYSCGYKTEQQYDCIH